MFTILLLALALFNTPYTAFEDCTIRIDANAPAPIILAVDRYNALPDELRMTETGCY